LGYYKPALRVNGHGNQFDSSIKIPILFMHIDWPEKTNSLIALNADPLNKVGGIDVELLLNQA
jgi:hypothetical protein